MEALGGVSGPEMEGSVQDKKKFEQLVQWVDEHPGEGGVIFVVSSPILYRLSTFHRLAAQISKHIEISA